MSQIYLLLIQDFCKSGILSQKLDNYHLPRVCCDINCYLTFHFFDKRFSKCMYQIWTLDILCGLLWHQLCTLTRRITQLSGKLPSHDVMTDSSYFPSKVQEEPLTRLWSFVFVIITTVVRKDLLPDDQGLWRQNMFSREKLVKGGWLVINTSIHHEKCHRLIIAISTCERCNVKNFLFSVLEIPMVNFNQVCKVWTLRNWFYSYFILHFVNGPRIYIYSHTVYLVY